MTKTKTRAMQLIEERHGIPLEKLLPSLFEDLRTFEAVAGELQISRTSLHNWVKDMKAEVHTERRMEFITRISFPNDGTAS